MLSGATSHWSSLPHFIHTLVFVRAVDAAILLAGFSLLVHLFIWLKMRALGCHHIYFAFILERGIYFTLFSFFIATLALVNERKVNRQFFYLRAAETETVKNRK